MPAQDKIHVIIKNALIKDGWRITAKPFRMELEGEYVYADIGAERTNDDQIVQAIVVEVKSFGQRSIIHALEEAFGQYQLYRRVLEVISPDIKVYLALSQGAYKRLQNRSFFRLLMRADKLSLIVVNQEAEEIVSWIEPANTLKLS